MERVSQKKKEDLKLDSKGPPKTYGSPFNIFNWVKFLSERAPPVVFLLLATGPCLSGLQMVEGSVNLEKAIWAIFGQLVILLTIRIMDDVKDYELDIVVHPDRPLPRGLLKYGDVVTAIHLVLGSLALYSGLMALRFSLSVGLTFGFQILYSYLMYIEFGIGEILEPHVFLYALTHQVSIYFGGWFICSLAGSHWYSADGFLLGSVAFSGFFTYEICRKLDPTLPLKKGTYLIVYGKWVTFSAVCCTVSIGVVSSYYTGTHWLLWPVQSVMILCLLVLFLIQKPIPNTKTHKPVELLSIIYLLLHMWSGYIASFW